MKALRSLLVVTLLAGISSAQPAAPTPGPTPVKNEPGPNGPGVGVPAPAPNRGHPVNTKPLTLDQREMEELKDVESEYDTFVKEADAQDKRMRTIARREYDNRTGELEKRYAERIAKTESDQAKRHTETYHFLFEATVARHDRRREVRG